MKIRSASISARCQELAVEFEVVGIAKDARYLTDNLDQPIGPFFFLPEAQADYARRIRARFSCMTLSS